MKYYKVINGPNINKLGDRPQDIYGDLSLPELINYTKSKLANFQVSIDWFQSNHEGQIIDEIQKCMDQNLSALIINPGGFSHTSVAIYDALEMLKINVVEVHLSNLYKREGFRQQLLTAGAAKAIISGLGKDAYWTAILSQHL